MRSMTKIALLFFLFDTTIAASVPPAPQQNLFQSGHPHNYTELPTLFTLSNDTSANGTSQTSDNVGDSIGDDFITCASFRSPNVDFGSCQDAWEQISDFGGSDDEVTFKRRHDQPSALDT